MGSLYGFHFDRADIVPDNWRVYALPDIDYQEKTENKWTLNGSPGNEALSGSFTIENPSMNSISQIELRFQKEDRIQNYLWDSTQSDSFFWDSRWLGFIPQHISIFPEDIPVTIKTEISAPQPPPLADGGIILSSPKDSSTSIYRWSLESSILVFDFKNYQEQADWLKRIAFFTEKPGFRGSLLSNEELRGKHGWNAHDYSAESLCQFYNQVQLENFTLNPEEYQLLDILLSQKILTRKEGEITYNPGDGAIISISKESSPYLRNLFFTHEGVHGLFFVNRQFQEDCFNYWESLDPQIQRAWKLFLRYNDNPYDPEAYWLVVTEYTAYMLQDSSELQNAYFNRKFKSIAEKAPETEPFLSGFLLNYGDRFSLLSKEVEALLQKYYPLSAGDFASIHKR